MTSSGIPSINMQKIEQLQNELFKQANTTYNRLTSLAEPDKDWWRYRFINLEQRYQDDADLAKAGRVIDQNIANVEEQYTKLLSQIATSSLMRYGLSDRETEVRNDLLDGVLSKLDQSSFEELEIDRSGEIVTVNVPSSASFDQRLTAVYKRKIDFLDTHADDKENVKGKNTAKPLTEQQKKQAIQALKNAKKDAKFFEKQNKREAKAAAKAAQPKKTPESAWLEQYKHFDRIWYLLDKLANLIKEIEKILANSEYQKVSTRYGTLSLSYNRVGVGMSTETKDPWSRGVDLIRRLIINFNYINGSFAKYSMRASPENILREKGRVDIDTFLPELTRFKENKAWIAERERRAAEELAESGEELKVSAADASSTWRRDGPSVSSQYDQSSAVSTSNRWGSSQQQSSSAVSTNNRWAPLSPRNDVSSQTATATASSTTTNNSPGRTIMMPRSSNPFGDAKPTQTGLGVRSNFNSNTQLKVNMITPTNSTNNLSSSSRSNQSLTRTQQLFARTRPRIDAPLSPQNNQ
jgi:hypothetical protein